MPTSTITNPNNAWQAGATYATEQYVQQEVVDAVNNSGGAVKVGDVVTLDISNMANYGQLITRTTTVNDKRVYGVVAGKTQGSLNSDGTQYAAGAVVPVIVKGPARINIAANPVAQDDVLTTSGVAGVAITNAGAPAANAVVGSLIAIAGEPAANKDANNTIRAYIQKF